MRKINVLITGTGGGGHGAQIAKALRLSKLLLKLHYADMSAISVGNSNKNFYLLPPASDNTYITALLNLCKACEIDVLFHGSEPELKKISDNRELFEKERIFLPINSKEVIDMGMDKTKTIQFLKANGFCFPVSIEVTEEFDFTTLDDFPYVLKPSVGSGGSQLTFIAQNANEIKLFSKLIFEKFKKFVVQQYVGNQDNEYTIGVLSDRKGRLIKSVAIRRIIDRGLGGNIKVKNKTEKSELGESLVISSGISQGFLSTNYLVCSQAEKIAKKLNSIGPLNLQCRLVNEKLYVFEINPRFSGTSYMRAMAGLNEPEILIAKYFNLPCEVPNKLKEGYYLRSLEEHFISSP